jgi:hypothetical protein
VREESPTAQRRSTPLHGRGRPPGSKGGVAWPPDLYSGEIYKTYRRSSARTNSIRSRLFCVSGDALSVATLAAVRASQPHLRIRSARHVVGAFNCFPGSLRQISHCTPAGTRESTARRHRAGQSDRGSRRRARWMARFLAELGVNPTQLTTFSRTAGSIARLNPAGARELHRQSRRQPELPTRRSQLPLFLYDPHRH